MASALLPGTAALAEPDNAAGIAIIDTPNNAAKYAAKLAAKNIKVVVRYYARKPQAGMAEKVMASNNNVIDGVREPTILARNGISVLSLYQYRNNLPEKFFKGLEDTGSAKAEIEADAKAALEQAKLVGQPEGSAIYFGVDFDVGKAGAQAARNAQAVLDYFRGLGRIVGNHYALGVYGNGYVNRRLREEKLVAYNWLSVSRSHEENPDFFNSGHWHLYQNQVDHRWFGAAGKCATGLDVDTSVQNPKVSGIGAWGAGDIEQSRNQAIFDQRRFAMRTCSVVQETATAGGAEVVRQNCRTDRVPRNANVRVLAQSGAWASVDIDEDGNPDGRLKTADLTASFAKMPPWDPTA
ncbi:MAG TPA: glycoside hydrolase domain-containing protein [Pseudolabrys sp.]|nr:glycoside hydrolase domain-containing protein [Pseudolabrys sp.]